MNRSIVRPGVKKYEIGDLSLISNSPAAIEITLQTHTINNKRQLKCRATMYVVKSVDKEGDQITISDRSTSWLRLLIGNVSWAVLVKRRRLIAEEQTLNLGSSGSGR